MRASLCRQDGLYQFPRCVRPAYPLSTFVFVYARVRLYASLMDHRKAICDKFSILYRSYGTTRMLASSMCTRGCVCYEMYDRICGEQNAEPRHAHVCTQCNLHKKKSNFNNNVRQPIFDRFVDGLGLHSKGRKFESNAYVSLYVNISQTATDRTNIAIVNK